MAPNVFGDPITDETLKALPEYANKEITTTDRAQVALSRKLSPPDFPVKVFGYIYNATGHPLKYASYYDWAGHVEETFPYPQTIENGQWGSFLHIGDYPPGQTGERKSTAAVIYDAENGLVEGRSKWAFTTFKAYGTFPPNWEDVRQKLFDSDHQKTDAAYGLKATVAITDGNSPTFHATITLDQPLSNA
nr:23 kDa jasmonate-induced protein-like [Ziziphus jujuba var. spinosa]